MLLLTNFHFCKTNKIQQAQKIIDFKVFLSVFTGLDWIEQGLTSPPTHIGYLGDSFTVFIQLL